MIPIKHKIKNLFVKIFMNKKTYTSIEVLLYSACIAIIITFFQKQFSWFYLLVGCAMYFAYEEIIKDLILIFKRKQ